MSDPKKISEGEFLAIVNAALRNPPTMLKDPNMSPQDRRDAAMRDLVLHLRQWFGLSPHIFVQSAFPIAALNYRFTIQQMLLNHSEPDFPSDKYLNWYMRALFGDKSFKAE